MKIKYLIFYVFTFPSIANAQNWQLVGNPGFSAGLSYYNDIAIDGNGTPYVAFQDYGNNYKATVMKYNSANWINVGNPGLSAGSAGFTHIAFDPNNTPYVVYSDDANDDKATVMKYNGSSWVPVGSADGLSEGLTYNTSIAIDRHGTPFVVYEDVADSTKATVMKYDGVNWVLVGKQGFSKGEAGSTSTITFDSNGTPYVIYEDVANKDKATVMKYNDTSWVTVGSAGFSADTAIFPSIAINYKDNTPYVVYKEGLYGGATVKKFNGSSWVTVGQPQFSDSTAIFTTIAIDSSGTPYVAYLGTTLNTNAKATVKKYDGSNWVLVGNTAFSARQAFYISIALDSGGNPYVGYSDYDYGQKATVMKFIPVLTITTGAIAPLILCAGSTINIPYAATGTFSGSNIFTAQLSDMNGNFSNPVNIGSVASISSGTIPVIIPANTTTGTGYRIRVVSSNPSITGSNNGSNITINAAGIAGTIKADKDTICENTIAHLTTSGNTGTIQWQFSIIQNNFANISGATSNFYTTPPLVQETWYRVISSGSACPDSTSVQPIIVIPGPTPAFTDSIFGLMVWFNADASKGAISYAWDFGDSSSLSSEQDPFHQYATHGTYQVCLTERNNSNCNFILCQSLNLWPAGINNITNEFNFQLYPNPTNGIVTIVWNKKIDRIAVQIFNSIGQEVKKQSFYDSNNGSLNLQNLTPGMYYIKINIGNEVLVRKVSLFQTP